MNNNINNIPVEKFQFAQRNDLSHDSKFETKPVSYFQGAFKRFCKNKGAVVGGIVIAILVLFAAFAARSLKNIYFLCGACYNE